MLTQNGYEVTQIGVKGDPRFTDNYMENLRLCDIKYLVRDCQTWISPDSFLQHLATHVGKPGIVIWSKSDPEIFGYKCNKNLLKDRKYLRERQFDIWENCEFDADAFVSPSEVVRCVCGN